jgi:hypothetical protein
MRRQPRRLALVTALAALLGVTTGAPGAIAQAEEKGPNTGRISLSAGADWTTDYYFRGIVQETRGYIVQPYGEVTFKLWDGVPAFGNLALSLGTWNSLHGGPTGIESSNSDPKVWYESDFYTRVGWTMFEALSANIVYTAYMSPNSAFTTVQELAFGFGYDDTKFLGPFALNPSALLAFEVKGQADGGDRKGVYLQLGLAPGYTFAAESKYPVTLSVPLLVGLSLDDYYEFGTGRDTTFGYFQGGVGLSVPLAFIPASFGSWTLKTGVNVLYLNGNVRDVNKDRDRTEIIGTVGLAFTY